MYHFCKIADLEFGEFTEISDMQRAIPADTLARRNKRIVFSVHTPANRLDIFVKNTFPWNVEISVFCSRLPSSYHYSEPLLCEALFIL